MFKKARPLKDPSDYEHGYQYALFLLNLSMRTVGEIKEKMNQRGYDKKVITEVINSCLNDKYLNDENYAEVFINSMKNYKTWGRFMMKKKMYEKKLDAQLIEDKLNELVTEDDELESAKRFLQRLFPDLKTIKKLEYDEKQKVLRKLVSRGFGMNVASKFIN